MILETQEIVAWSRKKEIDLEMLKILVCSHTVLIVGHPNIYNYENSLFWTSKIYAFFYWMLILFQLKAQMSFS